jgi:NitT/TauT family transport system permease protein
MTSTSRRVVRDRLLIVAAALLLWEVTFAVGAVSGTIAASPSAIGASMVELASLPEVRRAFAETVWMFLIAFALAGAGGVLVGAVLGLSRWAYRVFNPVVMMLFSTPKMIFIPLVILVFGIGFVSKVAYATISAIFPVIVAVAAGVRLVDQRLLTAANSLGASRWQIVRHVTVPGAVPAVFAGLWYGIKHALLGVLVMELFVSQRGIGYLIKSYSSGLRTDRVFALITALALVAIALGMFWKRIEDHLSRWRTMG